jgi:autotransporter-associated beta strand protein
MNKTMNTHLFKTAGSARFLAEAAVLFFVMQAAVLPVKAASYTWDGGVTGNYWGEEGNWGAATTGGPAFPGAAGDAATISVGATITLADAAGLDSSFTLASLTSNTGSINVTVNNVSGGTGTLIFDNGAGSASITTTRNSGKVMTFNVGITLNSNLSIKAQTSPNSLIFNKAITSGVAGTGINIAGQNSTNTQGIIYTVLNAASSYTGATTISGSGLSSTAGTTSGGGKLQIGANNVLPTTGVLAVNANSTSFNAQGGRFNLNGFNQTVGGLTGTTGTALGIVTNDKAAASTSILTVSNTADYTYNGIIANAITGGNLGVTALAKSGAGTQTLTGASTYSGGTTINGGTLSAGNSAALGTGIVTVNSGGTLLVQAGVNIANTVTVAGGAYNKSLSSGAAYNYAATSSFAGGQADTTASLIAGTAGAARTLSTSFAGTSAAGNDGIRSSDVFNLSGTGTDLFALQLQITSIPANSILGWDNAGTWVNAVDGNTGNNALLAQQGYLGSFSSFQSLYGTDLSTYVGAYGLDISANTVWAVLNHNSDFAVVTAVPEPSACILVGAGLMGLWFLRRRKRA